jgi:hypothetical protein
MDQFARLPPEVAHVIYSKLPVDTRLLCCGVSRGWRDALKDYRLWQDLDLTVAPDRGNVGFPPKSGVLQSVLRQAHGHLRALNLTGWKGDDILTMFHILLAAAKMNARTLVSLRVPQVFLNLKETESLLQAAPQLGELECTGYCSSNEARRMLGNEKLHCNCFLIRDDFADVLNATELAAAIESHAWLETVKFQVNLSSVFRLDTIVSAAIQKRLTKVEFGFCRLTQASLPSLARLLTHGNVIDFNIRNEMPLFSLNVVDPFCNALRVSRLVKLSLAETHFWRHPAGALAVLDAIHGHSTLRELDLSHNPENSYSREYERESFGQAMKELVGEGSTLEKLNLDYCYWDDARARALFQGVATSTRLRSLSIYASGVSPDCAVSYVLPAVRANTSLRELRMTGLGRGEAILEAEAVVRARNNTGVYTKLELV